MEEWISLNIILFEDLEIFPWTDCEYKSRVPNIFYDGQYEIIVVFAENFVCVSISLIWRRLF